MNETMVTMIGNVATVVSYSQTAAGVPVANFRMAATERRYDREKGDWVDGETSWVTVTAWRWLAANVVSSLSKGDPVVVSGRLRVREWGEEEKRRCVVEIDARVVGHDLGRGTTAFRWAVQAKPELVLGRSGREESAALPAARPPGSPVRCPVRRRRVRRCRGGSSPRSSPGRRRSRRRRSGRPARGRWRRRRLGSKCPLVCGR
ncbi:single-stranded DNA-binding protein [Kitasatospora gansuensis]